MRPYDGRSLTKISEENEGNELFMQAINRKNENTILKILSKNNQFSIR
jgi:hypothetical protein